MWGLPQATSQITAAGLRGLNLASKFLVTLSVAKFSSPEIVAVFGLYWTTVVLCSALMGVDLYAYTSRKILSRDNRASEYVGLHFGGLSLAALVLVPIILMSLYWGVSVLNGVLLLLSGHLILEFFSQEIARLLIALRRPFLSVVINTFRGAVWSSVAIGYIFYQKQEFDLHVVLMIWVFCSCFSLILGLIGLRAVLKCWPVVKVDWEWLSAAIKICSILFLGSVAFRLVVGADRYIVSYLYDVELAGYYIFFGTISFAVVGLIESGVSAWKYPGMVMALRAQRSHEFSAIKSGYVRQNLFASALLVGTAGISVYYVTLLFLDDDYLTYYVMFVYMLVGVGVYSASMPYHYIIYGAERDWLIVLNNFLSFAVFCGVLFSTRQLGINMAAVAFMAGLACLGVLRYIFSIIILQRYDWRDTSSI